MPLVLTRWEIYVFRAHIRLRRLQTSTLLGNNYARISRSQPIKRPLRYANSGILLAVDEVKEDIFMHITNK